uniref:(northern house mosquito) hypothetical protein n=1 Tax=Culex pipiens TaxID=7175 RepID=A0A8D8FX06_CULPI
MEPCILSLVVGHDQARNSGSHRSGRKKKVRRYRLRWIDLDLVQAVDVVLQLRRGNADPLLGKVIHKGLVEVDRSYAADLACTHPESSAGRRSGILYGRTLGALPAGTSNSTTTSNGKTGMCCW